MVDAPAGARLREVELYAHNTSPHDVSATVHLWSSHRGYGDGTDRVLGALTIAPGSALGAVRLELPEDEQGPYPGGTKPCLRLHTPVDGTVQVTGARFGFSGGCLETALLPAPRRVHDTQDAGAGGILRAGRTRTIALPDSVITPFTAGVIVNLTALRGARAGVLRAFPAGGAVPAPETLFFPSEDVAQAHSVVVPFSADGGIAVRSTADVHLCVDVVGTVA